MTRLGIVSLAGLLAGLAVGPVSGAEASAKAPDFKEVYDLVRAHLTGADDAELNRAAVQGLVTMLSPRVALAGDGAAAATNAPLVGKSGLFEAQIAYVRVGRVEAGVDQGVRGAFQQAASTNKLKGLVLDLRYAGGSDYAAAVATADLFVKSERPLLDWGAGLKRSGEKTNVLAAPVAVLVNRQTAGAAEALAAVLRQSGGALVLGGKTAGQAMITQDYPLKNGQRLRIATTPIRLGDGSAMAEGGVKPDIAVEVNPQDERAYYADAFRELSASSLSGIAGGSATNPAATNRLRRPRYNEADLVRERREGVVFDADAALAKEAEAERSLVRDPVLSRALDVLKGLALVRPAGS